MCWDLLSPFFVAMSCPSSNRCMIFSHYFSYIQSELIAAVKYVQMHRTLLFLHNYNIERQIRWRIIYDHPKTIQQYPRRNYSCWLKQTRMQHTCPQVWCGAHRDDVYTYLCWGGSYLQSAFFLHRTITPLLFLWGQWWCVCVCVCMYVCVWVGVSTHVCCIIV